MSRINTRSRTCVSWRKWFILLLLLLSGSWYKKYTCDNQTGYLIFINICHRHIQSNGKNGTNQTTNTISLLLLHSSINTATLEIGYAQSRIKLANVIYKTDKNFKYLYSIGIILRYRYCNGYIILVCYIIIA